MESATCRQKKKEKNKNSGSGWGGAAKGVGYTSTGAGDGSANTGHAGVVVVVNCKNYKKNLPEDCVYIGRQNPKFGRSDLGNPFKISAGMTRDDVVEKFREYLKQEMEKNVEESVVKAEMLRLIEIAKKDKTTLKLACWCNPLRCHGDVIKEYILQNI